MSSRKILLVEFNEITWTVIDKLIAERGPAFLPNFARLRSEGAWGVQMAVEQPPDLDPWITWVTLHTGVPPSVHGAQVLEQDSQSIAAPRLWDYVSGAGKSVGVFGSISAYPPPTTTTFAIPGPFAPGNETHPPELLAIQRLNRQHTQAHNKTQKQPTPLDMVRQAQELIRFGISPGTLIAIVRQLALERFDPSQRWRRVGLQPLLNFDFFANLYRKHRPDFATWHSNHAAHFMHHYWRAWDDSTFPAKSTEQERKSYGDAVPYGYALCDGLLGKFIRLMDQDTVLVMASSMGQQPFVKSEYPEGKIVVRIRDMEQLIDVMGPCQVDEAIPTMIPQWNLTIRDDAERQRMKDRVTQATRQADGVSEPAFTVLETSQMLTVTPRGLATWPKSLRFDFPGCPNADTAGYAFDALFVADTPTVKQGMHHRAGVVALMGAGIRGGARLDECTNLDIAPTLLSLMEIPVPSVMTGRPLALAW